ncbi:hypothetical protein [Variovorax boronicumulans]|uniref:hypothetical protein n=1 Tax=Variovorax boronicumulans TaxID=436515 RepID=UPI0027D7B527|nr:hypothetical protein [Variovorax boronicumulans]
MAHSDLHIDLSALRLEPTGWVAEAVLWQAKLSEVAPLDGGTARSAKRGLLLVGASEEWRELANRKTSAIDVGTVAEAYRVFEDVLVKIRNTPTSNAHVSGVIRRWCNRYLESAGLPRISRIGSLFATKLLMRHSEGRKLISDSIPAQLPLGALSLTSGESVTNKTLSVIESTLLRLEKACLAAFAEHERVAEKFHEKIALAKVDEKIIHSIRKMKYGYKSIPLSFQRWMERQSDWDLIRAYHAIAINKKYWVHGDWVGKQPTPGYVRLCDVLEQEVGIFRLSGAIFPTLMVPYVGTIVTLVACVVAIQKTTGWNISSVMELTLKTITPAGKGFVIQSFKSRSNDYTPVYHIEATEESAVWALNFLTKRLEWMKKCNWVEPEESRLWLRPLYRKAAHGSFVSLQKGLENFQKEFDLPAFSFEQLRVERLAHVALSKGSIEAARRFAGHASISTTGGYVIDQILLHRRNSTVSLDFQRELENSVSYVPLSGAKEMGKSKNGANGVKNLFYPLGDGSSCTDPHSPPDEDYLFHGVCDARRCHQGKGCSNRRIEIDENRMEEVVRLKIYYDENWKRLLSENSERFKKYDLPAMIFNTALLGVIRKGVFRYRFDKIAKRVSSENQ